MENNYLVDDWVIKFNNGDFDCVDIHTQIDAGWYDWFCKDESLPNKTKKLGKKVVQLASILSDEFKKDHYIWFKNNCPMVGSLYDDIRFTSILKDENTMVISPKDSHREGKVSIWLGSDYKKTKDGTVYIGDWRGAKEFIKGLKL